MPNQYLVPCFAPSSVFSRIAANDGLEALRDDVRERLFGWSRL